MIDERLFTPVRRCGVCKKTDDEVLGVNDQYSMDIFAMRAHDECWAKDNTYVKGGKEQFDPSYAGETYEEEEY